MTALSQAIFEVVDRIVSASSLTDVWDAYLGASARVGLRFASVGPMPRKAGQNPTIVASSLPKGFEDGYNRNELWSGDLLLGRARASGASFEWQLTDWPDSALSPAQRRWREHFLTFGILGGLCVLDFRSGEEKLLLLHGTPVQLSVHDRLALIFAGHEVINRVYDLAARDPQAAAVWLSERERQCLQWAAAGKTDWEIGQILSLSEKTVNVYITRAKAKFGVKSRAQAIILASRAGVIAA